MVADRVGAVVVAHARADLALRCIASLTPELEAPSIVAVVNAPALADQRDLERLRERSIVVSPASPQGFGANLNLGVAHLAACATMLLLLNDDVELVDGSMLRLVDTLDSDPGVAVVGPLVQQPTGKQPPLRPQFPTVVGACLRTTALPLGPLWDVLSRHSEMATARDPEPNGWVLGAAMLVRAKAFHDVGGFDPDFFLYYEETDFCYRVRAGGWRMAWRDDAPVLHLHAGSTVGSDTAPLFFGSERLYYRKRLGRLRFALLELGLAAIFVADCIYNAAMAGLRPRTARRRLEQLRGIWSRRIFLRPSRPYVTGGVPPRRTSA